MTHPIEEESYRILASRVDLGDLEPGPQAVVARVIHATADIEIGHSMVVDARAVDAGVAALRAHAPVITDVEMVRAGLSCPASCFLGSVTAGPAGQPTRSAMAIRAAAAANPDGAIWVVGCAPTALLEVVRLTRDGSLRPALVIGVPVGFVGAADAKVAARTLDVPVISNLGEKGGSGVAAGVVNALVRLAAAATQTGGPVPGEEG